MNLLIKITVTAISVVLFFAAWFCAVAQTARTNIVRVQGITLTNGTPESVVTNLTFEAGRLFVSLDSGMKINLSLSEEARTNFASSLIESGEFCRIRGHAWAKHLHVTLEYVSGKTGCRQCKACGLHQTQFADWK